MKTLEPCLTVRAVQPVVDALEALGHPVDAILNEARISRARLHLVPDALSDAQSAVVLAPASGASSRYRAGCLLHGTFSPARIRGGTVDWNSARAGLWPDAVDFAPVRAAGRGGNAIFTRERSSAGAR